MIMGKMMSHMTQKGASIIAACAMAFAVLSANSACGAPFYEPKQPEELQRWKKEKFRNVFSRKDENHEN